MTWKREMYNRELEGRHIVITGGNRGIGKAIVVKCAEEGADIWVCMRKGNEKYSDFLLQLARENKVDIREIYFDMVLEEDVKRAAAEILKSRVKIDGIVNNAGVSGPGRLFTMTKMEEIKEVFQINFFSPMLFTQKLVKNMIKNHSGSIVNMASIAAFEGNPGQLEYVASKAAMVGATNKLAGELNRFGIRVNAVAPGMTDTDMLGNMDGELKKRTLQMVAMQRLGEPEEIANAVVFLLSDKSSFVNGQTIRVDGGRS